MNKKYAHTFFVLTVFSLLVTVPSGLFAATTTSKNALYDWYRGGTEFQKAINKLDDKVVQEFAVPVLFKVNIATVINNYGDARGGGTRIHEGLDMMAPEGTPVVSPTEAVVTKIGDGSASGLFVATAVPGGETFVYMHLSAVADIEQGDLLQPGDLVGYVGHTGNGVASAPHLHLEVRNEDGAPTDPFPRLTKVFTREEKMEFLKKILDDHEDTDEFAEYLIKTFRSEFTVALAENIELPNEIEAAMKRLGIAVTTPVTVAVPVSPAPVVNTALPVTSVTTVLRVGARGSEVIALQKALIKKAVGTGAKLSADGAFGPMTRTALIQYQASAGLVADGVAGPKTFASFK